LFVAHALICFVTLGFERLSRGVPLLATCLGAAGVSLAISTLLFSLFPSFNGGEPPLVGAGGVIALVGSGLGAAIAPFFRSKSSTERKKFMAGYGMSTVLAIALYTIRDLL
jgi:hypothetical protein